MSKYSFIELNEGLFRDFLKHNAMCDRAHALRERVHNNAIIEIRKLKDLLSRHIIDSQTYKRLLDKQHSKLASLELRLSNLDLLY